MNEAIKLAIEQGGYNLFGHLVYSDRTWELINSSAGVGDYRFGKNQWRIEVTIPARGILKEEYSLFDLEKITSDPQFWQALGKALEWNMNCHIDDGDCRNNCVEMHQEHWLEYAIHYHKLSLTGGDTEAFWKELLKHV